jgi:Homeodomain
MHKRMKEQQCQELIPLMKRYLEDHEKEKLGQSNNIPTPPQEKVHDNRKRVPRCVFTSSDREILEESFKQNQFPSTSDKEALGKQLKVAPSSIKNWFKSR